MGKVSVLAEIQRERDKGNLETARRLEATLADKAAVEKLKADTPGRIESQMIAPGSQVDLPSQLDPTGTQFTGPPVTEFNKPDDSIQMQMAQALTEQKRLPTESERMQEEMLKTRSIQPYIDRIAPLEKYDIEGNLLPQTEEYAQAMTQENLALAESVAPQTIDYGYQTGKELMDQVVGPSQGLEPYNALSDGGLRLETALNQELKINNLEMDQAGQDFIDMMTTADLINPETKRFNRKAGNLLGMALVDAFFQEQVMKDKSRLADSDPKITHLIESKFDVDQESEAGFGSMFDDPESGTTLPVGTLLNPEYSRSKLAKAMIDKVMDNPNRIGNAVAGFGGASREMLNPKTEAMLENIAWQAVQNLGFVEEVTDNDRKFYRMSKDAVNFYEATRPLLNDINPFKMILPQLTPGVESVNITTANALGFDKMGNASVKSQRAADDSVQMQVVDTIGKMGNRVLPEALAIQEHQIRSVINYRFDGKRIIIDKNNPLFNARGQTEPRIARSGQEVTYNRFHSTHPLATALGLGVDKWNSAYNNAIKMEGKDRAEAEDQADAVMMMRARQVALDHEIAKLFANRVFYYNAFYATSNGRYHYRQTVMNPQNSKPIRNLLANPRKTLVNLDVDDMGSQKMFKIMYNIGRILLPASEYTNPATKGKSDRVGMNQIVNPTQKILSEGIKNPIYQTWLNKGRIVWALSQHNTNFPIDPNIAEEYDQLMQELSDPEDWGFYTRAYLDVYRFHMARENKKGRTPTEQIMAAFPGSTATKPIMVIPKAADNERVAQLEQMLQDAQELGDPDAFAQAQADIFKELETIRVPVEAPRSVTFESVSLAKPDGKQSGQALQAMQNRDIEIAKRTGIIYSDLDNVIPEGDIRSLFFQRFSEQAQNMFVSDDLKNNYWIKVLKRFHAEPEKLDGLIKELARTPLMEYGYGKYAYYNQAHIMNFLRTPMGQEMMEIAKYDDIPGYRATSVDQAGFRQLVNDFNILTGRALHQTMDVGHQTLLNNIGLFWGMMEDASPRFQSPLGDTVYLGSRRRVKTGESIQIPFERGVMDIPLTASVRTGSARPAGVNRGFDDNILKFVVTEALPYGKEAANQMAVLPTQVTDAAILGTTILRVNANRKDAPAWGIFIHDSIISDASGTLEYIRGYNDSFREIAVPGGKNFWNQAKAIGIALDQYQKEFASKLRKRHAKGETIVVSNEYDNNYRSLVDYINKIKSFTKYRDEDKAFINRLTTIGYDFNRDKQTLSAGQVGEILQLVYRYMELDSSMRKWIKSQTDRDPAFIERVNKELMTFL